MSRISACVCGFRAFGQLRSGVSWFYWIAGLSLINSILSVSGQSWRFIFGLGVTQLLDAFAEGFAGGGKIVGLIFDLVVAGVFVLADADPFEPGVKQPRPPAAVPWQIGIAREIGVDAKAVADLGRTLGGNMRWERVLFVVRTRGRRG